MADELDIPWDPSISPVFNGDDSPMFAACALLELPIIAVDLSRRSAPPPP